MKFVLSDANWKIIQIKELTHRLVRTDMVSNVILWSWVLVTYKQTENDKYQVYSSVNEKELKL